VRTETRRLLERLEDLTLEEVRGYLALAVTHIADHELTSAVTSRGNATLH
jgi:hypothetical protein